MDAPAAGCGARGRGRLAQVVPFQVQVSPPVPRRPRRRGPGARWPGRRPSTPPRAWGSWPGRAWPRWCRSTSRCRRRAGGCRRRRRAAGARWPGRRPSTPRAGCRALGRGALVQVVPFQVQVSARVTLSLCRRRGPSAGGRVVGHGRCGAGCGAGRRVEQGPVEDRGGHRPRRCGRHHQRPGGQRRRHHEPGGQSADATGSPPPAPAAHVPPPSIAVRPAAGSRADGPRIDDRSGVPGVAPERAGCGRGPAARRWPPGGGPTAG